MDKRRDPKADTGLFELVYKQNLPRPPAYLGMNLSVRGRRVFRNRYKNPKKDKEKENNALYKNKEISRNNRVENGEIQLPKINCEEKYKGPVIADFIEEIHNNFYKMDENGVDFVPSVSPPPIKKKNHGHTKKERVLKGCYTNKIKVNKSLSLPRRRKSNENNNYKLIEKTEILCNQWNNNEVCNVKIGVEKQKKIRTCWERETNSILVGKRMKIGDNKNDVDFNKNLIKTTRCLSSLSLVTIGYNCQKALSQ